MNKKDYQLLVSDCYQKMSSHYQNKFFFGDNSLKVKHLALWIEAICNERIPSGDLKPFLNYVLMESEAFSSNPPNPSQFIKCYREWSSLQGAEPDPFSVEFDEVYKKMGMRYERLFGGANPLDRADHRKFWKSELEAHSDSCNCFSKAYERVRSSVEYRQYPPNIDQFIEILKISTFPEMLLTPEEAFQQATSYRESSRLHPVVRESRSKFGYLTLIDKNNRQIKERFIDSYRTNLELYMSGQLNIASQDSVAEEPVQLANPASVSSMLDGLLDEL